LESLKQSLYRWVKRYEKLEEIKRLSRKPKSYKITKELKKINELETKNKLLQNDVKFEKFPEGAMVYVIEDIDFNGEIYYRIGKTDNMNKQINIYNTHSIHN